MQGRVPELAQIPSRRSAELCTPRRPPRGFVVQQQKARLAVPAVLVEGQTGLRPVVDLEGEGQADLGRAEVEPAVLRASRAVLRLSPVEVPSWKLPVTSLAAEVRPVVVEMRLMRSMTRAEAVPQRAEAVPAPLEQEVVVRQGLAPAVPVERRGRVAAAGQGRWTAVDQETRRLQVLDMLIGKAPAPRASLPYSYDPRHAVRRRTRQTE